MTDVVSIFGGPCSGRVPSDDLIEVLEEYLEMARSGEIIGGCVCVVHHNGLGSFGLAGWVGGYSLVGAMEMAKKHVLEANDE